MAKQTFLTDEDKKELEEKIEKASQSGGNGGGTTGSGLTTAQINALDGLFKIAAYTEDARAAYAAFQSAFGLSGGEEPDDPDVPVIPDEPDKPEKTLTGISATYSGGDVAVGTAVSDLTGIVVTAFYSDGSTETVTDYTLSGTIVEGSNTVTVSYGGKTTTFAVSGVAESGGMVENLFKWTEDISVNANATSLVIEPNSVSFACSQQTGYYRGIEIEGGKTYTLFFDASNTNAGVRLHEAASIPDPTNIVAEASTIATVYGKKENNCKTFTVDAGKPYIILGFMCYPADGATLSAWTNLALYEGTLTERP